MKGNLILVRPQIPEKKNNINFVFGYFCSFCAFHSWISRKDPTKLHKDSDTLGLAVSSNKANFHLLPKLLLMSC